MRESTPAQCTQCNAGPDIDSLLVWHTGSPGRPVCSSTTTAVDRLQPPSAGARQAARSAAASSAARGKRAGKRNPPRRPSATKVQVCSGAVALQSTPPQRLKRPWRSRFGVVAANAKATQPQANHHYARCVAAPAQGVASARGFAGLPPFRP